MRFEVTEADTAEALGSGDLPVLGTPRLIAWLEAATVACAAPSLAAGQTTVGTAIHVRHRRPTPVGGEVEVFAEVRESTVEGRMSFTVRAVDGTGQAVATGEIERAVVDGERFLGSVPASR
ncbi:thioesterase [Amycolatopsis acidicola]|uniref:Thioesterase n=1 Tax=Amycolatopsis acidicola TaxID=2596893 RepID=A0A5N0UQW9_9PSEU|nr:hotdog domain-containing protein [Amycolatopsis acidicola]KAA9152771.1 thioesterase [Amycolatopsis acidicola]